MGGADDLKALTTPTVNFLILADRAEAVNGKLYMMGGAWEHVFVQNLQEPALLSLAVGILVPWSATNKQHRLRIAIEDGDAKELGFNAEAGFAVGRPPWAEVEEVQRVVIAIPTAPILFPGYGHYVLQSYINGERAKQVRFRAMNPASMGPLGFLGPAPAAA